MKSALNMMTLTVRLALVLGLAASTYCARAQGEIASGVLTDVPGGGNTFDYTITVSNSVSATSPIGSFWYSWIPGQFYLPSQPSSVAAPLGWSAAVASGGSVYSIQYIATNTAFKVSPGGTLSVTFVSTDTPTTLAGNAAAHPGTPIGTTVAYSGGLFSDGAGLNGDTFVVQSLVPEPSALSLLGIGAALVLGAGIRRRLCGSQPG